MLRRLHAARRLGGLAAALPRAAEPLDALRVLFGAWQWRAAAAKEALRSEGCSRSAVTRTLGTPRGFCVAAGSGDGPAKPPVAAAAPPERESAAARGDAARIDVSFVLGAVSLAGAGAATALFVGHSVKEGNAEVKAELTGIIIITVFTRWTKLWQ